MAAGMWIAAAAALLGAAPAPPTVMTGELVLPRADTGFVLHQATTQFGTDGYEYRLRGETTDTWSRTVVLSRAIHLLDVKEELLAKAKTIASLTAALSGARIRLSCPAASLNAPPAGQLNGRASATLEASCPADAATHDPIITRLRVVVGDDAVHVVSAMVRGTATRADVEWADRVIADLTLCGAADVAGRCAARSRVIGDAL